MKKNLVFVLLPVALVLLGAGCGKKAAENAAEKAIERSTNGAADVDISTNSITMNVNGSSWQFGDSVQLPDGFPSDLYVIDGTLKSAMTTIEGKSYTITISTTKSVKDAASLYNTRLLNDGWTITGTASFGGTETIVAKKAIRSTTVGITADTSATNTTSVVVTTFEDENSSTNTASE